MFVGFSARTHDGMTPEVVNAKYINSPGTPIFHKGNILFGLQDARLHVSAAGHCWLVKGQLDVFRCSEAGMFTLITPRVRP
jgi:DNA primase